MHLTTKQIATLLLPFLVAGVVYMFDFDIAKNIKYLFPVYKEYQDKTLDKKAAIYLQIESNGNLYQEIKKKIKNRKEEAKWIVEKVLYKKAPMQQTKKVVNTSEQNKKTPTWKLEAVFAKLKVAIINGTVVKEHSTVDGARVLKILDNRVLLHSKKGKRWVYLFR